MLIFSTNFKKKKEKDSNKCSEDKLMVINILFVPSFFLSKGYYYYLFLQVNVECVIF